MKINLVLIGGNGFMGSSFREYIKPIIRNIIVVGRTPVAAEGLNYSFLNYRDFSYQNLQPLLQDTHETIFIDFAYTSVPNTSFQDPVKDFSENLSNIIHHLEVAKALNISKYVYISSGGTVYGNHGFQPLKEETVNYPISPYGITKLACERYVDMYFKAHQVPFLIIRPSNVYGPGQIPFRGQGLAATVMASILTGQPVSVFGGDQIIRDYIFIDDFSEALLLLSLHGKIGETYNVGSGIGLSLNKVLAHIEAVTVPLQIAERKVFPARPFDIQCNILDCSKIQEHVNWSVKTDLPTGLAKTWQWINNSQKGTL